MDKRGSRALRSPELSVVLAVGNAEDDVGTHVRRCAERLRSLSTPFEILAVNQASADTSFSVLSLLSREIPELQLVPTPLGRKAFVRGLALARGDFGLLFSTAGQDAPPAAAFGYLLSRLRSDRDALIVRGRGVALRRLPALPVVARATGPGLDFERSFERAARAADLSLEVVGQARPAKQGLLSPVLSPLLRFLAA